jgi:hypothetical protein
MPIMKDNTSSEATVDTLLKIVQSLHDWYVTKSVLRSVVEDVRGLVPTWAVDVRMLALKGIESQTVAYEYHRIQDRIRATDDAHKTTFPIEVAILLAFCALVWGMKVTGHVPIVGALIAAGASVVVAICATGAHHYVIMADAPIYAHYLVTGAVTSVVIGMCGMVLTARPKPAHASTASAMTREDYLCLMREVRDTREEVLNMREAILDIQALTGRVAAAPQPLLLEDI